VTCFHGSLDNDDTTREKRASIFYIFAKMQKNIGHNRKQPQLFDFHIFSRKECTRERHHASQQCKRLLQDHKKYSGIQRNERSGICARSGTGEISKMLVKIIIFVQDEVMHKYN
jgi:hypothetical protein